MPFIVLFDLTLDGLLFNSAYVRMYVRACMCASGLVRMHGYNEMFVHTGIIDFRDLSDCLS